MIEKRCEWKKYKIWLIMCVYKILSGLFNSNGVNIIVVKVIDMGGFVGIYEGLIGIIDEEISLV